MSRFGRNPPYITRALLHSWRDKISMIFSRRNLTGSEATPRSPGIPPITDAQALALDTVHFTAAAHCVRFQPHLGDMFFVNNFAVMHSRNAFQDDDIGVWPRRRRYVLRLWLDNPEHGWGVPPGLQLAWDRIFEDAEEIENHVEIDPYFERDRSLSYTSGRAGGYGTGSTRSASCG